LAHHEYFGARYYNSALGRFMTPDWSAAPVAVPYANLENPQSLNLYAYVQNDPVTGTDPDGHFLDGNCGDPCTVSGPASIIPVFQTAEQGARTLLELFQFVRQRREDLGNYLQAHPVAATAFTIAALILSRGEAAEEVEEVGEPGAGLPKMTQFGWEGSASWRAAVSEIRVGGTIEEIAGKVPTEAEAESLLKKAGAVYTRSEGGHFDGRNPHSYDHINYRLSNGTRGTVRIQGPGGN
jgi:RHS repeat-associated protein